MTAEPPPIQQSVTDSNPSRFSQVWLRWFDSVTALLNDSLDNISTKTRATSSTTIDSSIYHWIGNTDSGPFTFSLPPGVDGEVHRIINTGSSGNSLTVSPNGSEHLLGSNSNTTLADGESLILVYDDNDGWY